MSNEVIVKLLDKESWTEEDYRLAEEEISRTGRAEEIDLDDDSEPVEESAEDDSDLADAALSAIADALLSGAGPDGRPSRKARQRAKRILDTMQDGEAVRAIEREVSGAGEGAAEP